MNRRVNLQAWGLTLLRVVVGVVFLMHGGQKFQMGFGQVAGFLGSLGIPAPNLAAIVLTLVEFAGGVALLLGLLTRLVAFLLAIDMAVAIVTVKLKGGFFAPNGFEYDLTLLAACLALALAGGGAACLERRILRKSAAPE